MKPFFRILFVSKDVCFSVQYAPHWLKWNPLWLIWSNWVCTALTRQSQDGGYYIQQLPFLPKLNLAELLLEAGFWNDKEEGYLFLMNWYSCSGLALSKHLARETQQGRDNEDKFLVLLKLFAVILVGSPGRMLFSCQGFMMTAVQLFAHLSVFPCSLSSRFSNYRSAAFKMKRTTIKKNSILGYG